jgi:hypothetical protein
MSDPDPDDQTPATPARETRSSEAARRLSQLLARPLGAPAPPGETPYVPRVEHRPPPPLPATEPADNTASPPAVSPPVPPAASAPIIDPEPDLPWFDRPVEPKPPAEPAREPAEPVHEAAEPVHEAAGLIAWPPPPAPAEGAPPDAHESGQLAAEEPGPHLDDDLFDHHDSVEPHVQSEPMDVARPPEAPPPTDESAAWPHAYLTPRERAWPPPVEPVPEPLPPSPEPPRPVSSESTTSPATAGRPLDPDAARALDKIRRLMLISNLFMLVAIAAVLGVVGYRVFRAAPAPPPTPPAAPVATSAPAPAIPLDMTLTLPRGARIKQTAVAGDRLVITLEIDGATEVRTFDLKTLQPTGRLSFGSAP